MIAEVPRAMASELPNHSEMGKEKKTRWKFSRVNAWGQRRRPGLNRSLRVENATTTIQ